MVAATVEGGADVVEHRVEGAIAFCFEHAAYAFVGEKTMEGMGAVGKAEVHVEAGGGGPLSTGGEHGVEVLEDGDANEMERTM